MTPRPRSRRSGRRLLGGLVAATAAVATGLLTPSPALGAGANGSTSVTVGTRTVDVTFNTPGNDAQWDQAARLIRQASTGSTIRIGLYNLTSTTMMDALRAAHANGVKIWVVANGEHHTDGQSPMLGQLKSLLGSRFRWCDSDRTSSNPNDACISDDPSGLMHAKYMMFSETKGRAGAVRKNVVWVSSANFSGSGKDLYNNSVTVYADKDLYDGFLSDVWQPMWTDPGYSGNDYYYAGINRGLFGSSASNSTVYVSPEQTTDLWVNRLDYVTPSSGCRIRVMHAIFNDTRIAVAKKLRSLAAGGCQVRVVVGSLESGVKGQLDHPNISVRRAAVHDKAIIINARYAGSSANRKIVFTGSHNLSLSALKKNDELIVKLADSAPLHDAFVEHFTHAWQHGSGVAGGSSS